MKAIVTLQNQDGTFDTVGMNNRRPINNLKTVRGHRQCGRSIRWQSPPSYRNSPLHPKLLLHIYEERRASFQPLTNPNQNPQMIAKILFFIGVVFFMLGMLILASLPIGANLHPETIPFVTAGKNLLITALISILCGAAVSLE